MAQALHGTAVQLAAHNHRVDHAAHVVDRCIGHHVHVAGLCVHLHLGQVAAIGPGGPGHGAGGIHEDALVALAGGQCKQINGQIGAFDLEAGVAVGDVFSRHLKLFGGQQPGCVNGALGANAHGRAAGEEGTRARTAKAVAPVGITQHDAHFLNRHAKGVDHQLCQCGGNALAHGIDGRKHFDDALWLHGHGDALFKHVAAGPFQKGGDAQAAHFAARF